MKLVSLEGLRATLALLVEKKEPSVKALGDSVYDLNKASGHQYGLFKTSGTQQVDMKWTIFVRVISVVPAVIQPRSSSRLTLESTDQRYRFMTACVSSQCHV